MKKGVLLVSSFLFSLILVEVGLHLGGYDVNTHPFWKYDEQLGWVIGEFTHFDQVNSTGFRYTPIGDVKPHGTKRLLILGDSFTLGSSLSYSKTLPGVLERLLASRGKWEVVSLAVDDWGWAQQLIALENIGLELEPDVVVSQLFPLNDFCNNCMVTANTCSMQDYQRPYFGLEGDQIRLTSLYPWRKALRDRFKLAGLFENLLDDPWAKAREIAGDKSEHPDLSGYFEHNARNNGLEYPDAIQSLLPPEHRQEELSECWLLCERILAKMESVTEDHRIPLIALVIPFLYTLDDRWVKLQELSSAPIDPLNATNETERILKDLEVPTVSVRSRITKGSEASEDYFISLSDGHLSEFGHSRLAGWILEEMESERLVVSETPSSCRPEGPAREVDGRRPPGVSGSLK